MAWLLCQGCLAGPCPLCTLFVDSGGSSRCSWCRSCCSRSSLSRRQIRPSYCDFSALIRTSSSVFCSSRELLFCFHSSFSFVSCSFVPGGTGEGPALLNLHTEQTPGCFTRSLKDSESLKMLSCKRKSGRQYDSFSF